MVAGAKSLDFLSLSLYELKTAIHGQPWPTNQPSMDHPIPMEKSSQSAGWRRRRPPRLRLKGALDVADFFTKPMNSAPQFFGFRRRIMNEPILSTAWTKPRPEPWDRSSDTEGGRPQAQDAGPT